MQKKRFSQKLSNLEIWSLLATCRKLYTIIGPLKSKMAEILHLENRHDVIFSAEGGPIWIKFRRLVQNDISPAVIWSKSKPDVEFQYVWANYMACPPRATCHIEGAATWRFQCHDPRATCHIAGCCHLVNSLSRFQSHMPHCRLQLPGEINVMIVPHCRMQEFHSSY